MLFLCYACREDALNAVCVDVLDDGPTFVQRGRHNELTHRLLVTAAAPSRQSNVSTAPGVLTMPTDTYPTTQIRRPSTHPRLSHPILGYRGHTQRAQNTGLCMTTAYNCGPHRNSPFARERLDSITSDPASHDQLLPCNPVFSPERYHREQPWPELFDGCQWPLFHMLTSLDDTRLNLAHGNYLMRRGPSCKFHLSVPSKSSD